MKCAVSFSLVAGLFVGVFAATPLPSVAGAFLGPLGQPLASIEGKKAYDINVLNVSELKKCVALRRDVPELENQLGLLQVRVRQNGQKLDSLILQMDNLQSDLQSQQSTALSKQAQVDAFNRKVDRFNGLNRAYQRQVEKYDVLEAAYNGLVNEHRMLLSIHKASCEARPYYREDLVQVLAALGEVTAHAETGISIKFQ